MPKKFLHKLSIIVACLIVFIGTIIPTHANNFYGIQPLKPMVEGDKTAIHLLGGVRATVGEQTEYSLTDHLQSTRLAVAGDNTTSELVGYTPFGDTTANTTTETAEVGQYTGMNYEPETATYDYHARAYDGSTARFTSPDAIRESISPYSYTANNPINNTDPDGNGTTPFILTSYSKTFRPISNVMESSKAQTKLVKEVTGILNGLDTYIYDADYFFDIRLHTTKKSDTPYKAIQNAVKTDTFSNRWYWFIFDNGNAVDSVPPQIKEKLTALQSLKNGFATDLTLVNFTGKDLPEKFTTHMKEITSSYKVINAKHLLGARKLQLPNGIIENPKSILAFGDKPITTIEFAIFMKEGRVVPVDPRLITQPLVYQFKTQPTVYPTTNSGATALGHPSPPTITQAVPQSSVGTVSRASMTHSAPDITIMQPSAKSSRPDESGRPLSPHSLQIIKELPFTY